MRWHFHHISFEGAGTPVQSTQWKGREGWGCSGSVAAPGAVREETPTGTEEPALGLINSVDWAPTQNSARVSGELHSEADEILPSL